MLTLATVNQIYGKLKSKPKRRRYTAKQKREVVDNFIAQRKATGISANQFELDNELTLGLIHQWKSKLYGGKK